MSPWGIGVGDIIKDFNKKLQREQEEVKRLREAIAKRDALVNSMNTATVAFIDKYYALDDYMLYTGEEE